jgi:hypothetical protein
MDEQPSYPIMAVQVTPGGILLTIIRSTFDRQTIIIPAENADAIIVEWLNSRPAEVKSKVVQQLTKIEIARIKNPPRGLKAVH